MKAKRFHLDDGYKAENGYIYLENRQNGGISFGTHEALVIHEAVKKDIAAGTCGSYNWFDSGRAGQYAMDLSLEFRIDEKRENGATYNYYDNINIAVYPAMTHTVQALLELDLVETSDLKTYAEMYPEDYDAEYWALREELGYDLDYKTYLDIRDGAVSVGIIGGADGPTEVVVAEPAPIR